MKLYHATDHSNKNSILRDGLWPTDAGSKAVDPSRKTLQGQNLTGVFGFTSKKDAKDFSLDNYGDGVIFSFETNDAEIITDPEYDGSSKFAITENPLSAKLVWEQWK